MSTSHPLRVLAVDPHPFQLWALGALLEPEGILLRTALDGFEAEELLASFRPQVLLTELVLSGFSGLELIRRCKTRDKQLKVLVLTAASNQWVTTTAFGVGADFVLLKPTGYDEVVRFLRALNSDLSQRIMDLLRSHGAPARWAGFRQTARCADLLAQGGYTLLKEVYIQVAKEEGSSPANVAKSVERFLKEFSRRTDLSFLDPYAPDGLADNRDFLLALARCATFPL